MSLLQSIIGMPGALPFGRGRGGPAPIPTNLTVEWIDDFARLSWDTDKDGKFEIWEEKNNGGYERVATRSNGVISYDNYTWQNASMKFKVRGVGSSSEFSNEVLFNTPLVWQTDQSTLTTVNIPSVEMIGSASIIVHWGDGLTTTMAVGTTSATHNYVDTGNYFIKIFGDINQIFRITHQSQTKSYGDISKWILPQKVAFIYLNGCRFTGDISNWVIPASCFQALFNGNRLSGKLPDIEDSANGLIYRFQGNGLQWENAGGITGSNLTSFRRGMTQFYISEQYQPFPQAEMDSLFKSLADYYEVNTPTANCIYLCNGFYMAGPTGGDDNPDIVRLKSYYTEAGRTATITIEYSFDNGKFVWGWDDSVESQYTKAFPVFVSKQVPSTFYTVGSYIDQIWQAKTWAELKEMHDAGMDIQGHGWTHSHFTTFNESQVDNEMQQVNDAFIANGLPAPTNEAYPYGSVNTNVKVWISKWRTHARAVGNFGFYVQTNTDRYAINAMLIDSVIGESGYDLLKKRIDIAVAAKKCLNVFNHFADDEPGDLEGITVSKMEEIIDYVKASGMDMISFTQLGPLLDPLRLTGFTVKDTSDNPVSGVQIVAGGKTSENTTTAGVTLIYLKDGSYSWEASKTGYATQSAAFTVIGENKYITITLVAT